MNAITNIFDPARYAGVRKPLLEAETLPPECYTDEAFYRREVETIFLTPGERHQYTSSTFVREIAVLGGEVDNPRWKSLWPGRLAFNERGVPSIAAAARASRIDATENSTAPPIRVTKVGMP